MKKPRIILAFLLILLLFSCSMPQENHEEAITPAWLVEIEEGTASLSSPASLSIIFSIPERPSDYGATQTGVADFTASDYGCYSIDGDSAETDSADERSSILIPGCGLRTVKDLDGVISPDTARSAQPTNVFKVGEIWEDVNYLKDNDTLEKTDLRCVEVTENAYTMVDTSLSDTDILDRIHEITLFFEENYEMMTSTFSEPYDVDGNGKIIIAFAPIEEGTLGYFLSTNYFPAEEYPESNMADIIFLNTNGLNDDNAFSQIKVSVVHEFQHLLNFSNDILNNPYGEPMALWIDEGLSMIAECFTGDEVALSRAGFAAYGIDGRGEKSLIEFSSTPPDCDYGMSILFMHYLRLRFGDAVIEKLYDSTASGYKRIEKATGEKFNTLFRDFCIMLLTTGRGLTTDPSYEIPGFNCTKEDPEYIGFNISKLIADHIPATDLPIENEKMKPYSFRIIRWNDDVKSISYEDTGSEITCLTLCK